MKKKSLKFHIESNDYFGTLATILDLLRQQVFKELENPEKKILENKIAELLYLQKNYKIVKKQKTR